jgi:hypothetical protein
LWEIHPGEAVARLQRNHRDDTEQHDDHRRQPEEAGKRAPRVEGGTHRQLRS